MKKDANKPKTVEALLAEISEKLDMLILIAAIQGKDRNAQVDILTKRGIDAKKIGLLLGMSAVNVRQVRWTNANRR